MNARISALASEAYRWSVAESKDGPNICTIGSDFFQAMEQKKFAELLIRECYMLSVNGEHILDHYGLAG